MMADVQTDKEASVDNIKPDPEPATGDSKTDSDLVNNTNSEDNQLTAGRDKNREVTKESVGNTTDHIKSEKVPEHLLQPSNSDKNDKEIKTEKSEMLADEERVSKTHSTETIQKESMVDSRKTGVNEINIETMKENIESNGDEANEKDNTIKAHNKNVETNHGNIKSIGDKTNPENSDTKAHTTVENIVARDSIDKKISSEFIPDLNIDDTDVKNSRTNIDSGDVIMGPDGEKGTTDSNKVLWTLNGSDLIDHKVSICLQQFR